MPNLFSSLSQLSLGEIIGSLSFWVAGTLLIVYDLIRMYREPRQDQQRAWYERPWLWSGGNAIVIGLVIWLDMMIATLPDLWSQGIFFLVFIGCYLLLPISFMISLVQGGKKREKPSRKAHAERHASSTHIFIRKNPLLANTPASLLIWAHFDFMVIWGACGLLLRLIPNELVWDYLSLGLGLFTVWGINMTLVHLRHFKRIERLRVELAERNWLEAAATPAPIFPFQGPEQLITPPLLLRPTWRAMGGWLVYGLVFGTMFTQPFPIQFLPVEIFKIFIILLTGSVAFFIRSKFRSKVEATQYNLISVDSIHTSALSWQEARLFACYQMPNSFFEHNTRVIYELSSPNQVVLWARVINARSPFALWRPVLPMDEYQRQMQAFCNLITEKTGLQLHNLSEAEPIEMSTGSTQERAISQIQRHD